MCFARFLATIERCKNAELFPWTLIIEDPMDASFIYSAARDGAGIGTEGVLGSGSINLNRDFDDGVLKRETYTRSPEENTEFGIDDMLTQQYARCPDCGKWAESCTCSDDGYGGKNDFTQADWTHDRNVTCWDFEKALMESLGSGPALSSTSSISDY